MATNTHRRSPRHKGSAFFVLLLVTAWLWSRPASAQIAITNYSANFTPGPYTAIALDPGNPDRAAVATAKGMVSSSKDGGPLSTDSLAIVPRRYDAMALRGGARAGIASNIHKQSKRATLLFISMLRNGLPPTRWAHWMAVGEPLTDISDISMPIGAGRMAIASLGGIYVSDKSGSAWHRVLGGPGPMYKDGDLMGLSVAMNPRNQRHLLAGTDQGVFLSTDGGANFRKHPDPGITEVFITRWLWDADDPNLIFAVADEGVYLSEDGGKTFGPAFAPPEAVKDISVGGEAVLVSTDKGLYLIRSEGTEKTLEGHDIIGAVGAPGGGFVAATKETVYYVSPGGETTAVTHTSEADPYVRVVGKGDVAWILSKNTVLKIAPAIPRRKVDRGYKPPRLLLSQIEMEKAVLKHTGLGAPEKSRMHARWYAKILPRVVVQFEGGITGCSSRLEDATLPVRYRQTKACSQDQNDISVTAMWDLSNLVFGDHNASNPFALLESNLRENRKVVLEEIRWRYRESATLANALRKPPEDETQELLWRSRLEEYASYLEFMSGRDVLADNLEEIE